MNKALRIKTDSIYHHLTADFCGGSWFSLGADMYLPELSDEEDIRVELTSRKYARILVQDNLIVAKNPVTFICKVTGEYDYVAWCNSPAGEPTEWIPLHGMSLFIEEGDRVTLSPVFAVMDD